MLLIGSRALLAHGVKVGRRPMDTDYIATMEEYDRFRAMTPDGRLVVDKPTKKALRFPNGVIVEFELYGCPNDLEINPTAAELVNLYGALGYPDVRDRNMTLAVHPDVVLTLKLSHRYLKNNPHFRKTMDDILALRGLKFRVPPQLRTWLKRRERATYNYSHPSLIQTKGEFFGGDGVNYVYEHDDIHEALATHPFPWMSMNPRPAYVQFQKDPRLDVSVSKEKWDNLVEDIKLSSVYEESCVLALERSQIPNDFGIAPRTSFLIALEKVCTSITSGWWREYAWENYYKVLGMYNDDYVDRFQKALANGKIRPYQGKAA
jgi:hypothetical protein